MNTATVLRVIANVSAVASTLLLLIFVFGGREHIRFTTEEFVGFLLFPVGIIVGGMIAFRWQMIGGLITTASLTLFFIWLSARNGRFIFIPYSVLFAAHGFLHIASSLMASRRGR